MDIQKTKAGSADPEAVMFDGSTPEERAAVVDWHKYANDSGGYYVRGIWIAPTMTAGYMNYWWPWDLGVTSGGLKDKNDGWSHWGYVQDGTGKNLTSGINKSFPTNGYAITGVSINVYTTTGNVDGTSALDLAESPIVITFLDGRFDDTTWATDNGSECTWSDDKRTLTITKVGKGHVVCHSTDYTEDNVAAIRALLVDLYADVAGLEYWTADYVARDASNVECWDAYVGGVQTYHKDKTVQNCWVKYGYAADAQVDAGGGYGGPYDVVKISTPGSIADGNVKLPMVTDLAGYILAGKFVAWRISPKNTDVWDGIKALYDGKSYTWMQAKWAWTGSGVTGALAVRVNTDHSDTETMQHDLAEFLSGTKVTGISLVSDNTIIGHDLFRYASSLRDISFKDTDGNDKSIPGDCSGMFEGCSSLAMIPGTLVDWGNTGFIPWMFSGCTALKEIPAPATDAVCHATSIQQLFEGCSKLESVGVTLDLGKVHPQATSDGKHDGSGGYLAFSGCKSLAGIKISGLNHGDWYLDGTGTGSNAHGELPALGQTSVDWLLDHLADLTAHDENKCTSTWKNNFGEWTINNPAKDSMVDAQTLKITSYSESAYDDYSSLGKESFAAYVDVENDGLIVFRVKGIANEGVLLHFFTHDTEQDVWLEAAVASQSMDTVTFEVNGSYTVAFYLSNATGAVVDVNVSLPYAYDPENPYVSNAKLYLPAGLADLADSAHREGAIEKGWTLYFGGE